MALCLAGGLLLRGRLDPAPLTTYVLQVALPALAIAALHDAPLPSFWAVSSVWLVFGAASLVFYALGRVFRWDRATIGCLILCCGLSNTSFFGFPLLEATIGPHAIPFAVPIDQLGSFFIATTAAPAVAAVASGQAVDARALVGRMLRFPALWAVLAAFLVPSWPGPLLDALERIGQTLSPVALVAVGAQLRLPDREGAGPISLGLAYKLVLAPALVWGWVALGGLSGLGARVAVLESAMSPMVTGALLAVAYGLRPRLAGALLGVGAPLSLFTVWLWSRVVIG